MHTPDPLGLAGLPALAAVVTERHQQAVDWHSARRSAELARHVPPPAVNSDVVLAVEQTIGRPVRPFHLNFLLLPVRDDVIRRVDESRYLIPERIYDGPRWAIWLRDLLTRIG